MRYYKAVKKGTEDRVLLFSIFFNCNEPPFVWLRLRSRRNLTPPLPLPPPHCLKYLDPRPVLGKEQLQKKGGEGAGCVSVTNCISVSKAEISDIPLFQREQQSVQLKSTIQNWRVGS